jgi:transcriptional regulator with XRE-family HTH domain
MRKLGYAGVEPRTIADLRRAFGPSQAAFAAHCDITQAQVSLLENGKVDPRAATIEKIAVACGLEAGIVRELVEHTQQRLTDEGLRTHYELEQMTLDLYPRTHDRRSSGLRARKLPGELYPLANESARLNLAAQALALGRRAYGAAAARRDVNWLALGALANDLYREVNAAPWQQVDDLAVSRAAFQLVRDMCRDFDERQQPEPRGWRDALRNLVRDADAVSPNALDLDVRRVGTDLLAIALREPTLLVEGIDDFSAAWSDLVFGAAEAGHELAPVQLQVSGVANLLKGVRHGVEEHAAAAPA